MKRKASIWLLFALLSILASASLSITLESHVGVYIRELLQEFKNDPTSSRFDIVIQPKLIGKTKNDFFLPKVFIWCPMDHFRLNIRCPEHGNMLEAMQWTDITDKISPRNPRLVYDLHGNYLLIQRFYSCRHGKHKYLSAAPEIMRVLPRVISHGCFPLKMLYKTACSKEVIDLVISEVVQGVNFLQISEGMANLNFKEFCRRGERYLMSNSSHIGKKSSPVHDFVAEDFFSDKMFSFPSNDLLMRLFLEDFEEKKSYYDEELRKTRAKVLSFDHTFKVSKHIGVARQGDSKMVGQFSNLFIGLNENKEIVTWKLTRSTKFEEVEDVLVELNERILAENERIKTIYVDDCCKVRAKYKTIFENEEDIKLDLFHGVQRVVKTLPKRTEVSKRIANEFGLVFRADGDLGNIRTRPTPDPEKIEENLEQFVRAWNEILLSKEYTETRNEIEKLKSHIRKGCLSGINPGEGTEGNEVLHHFINRCLLCGSTTIGPELAMAILTILFYSLNSKKKGSKHERNARTNIYIPIEGIITKSYSRDLKENLPSKCTTSQGIHDSKKTVICEEAGEHFRPESSVLLVADSIENLCNEVLANTILNHVETMNSMLERISKECNNRLFNIFDFPILQLNGLQHVTENFNTDGGALEETAAKKQLARNLSGLGLEVDDVDGDGDCAFTSIMKQVIDLSLRMEGEERDRLLLHLEVLGLNAQSAAENVGPLRQLFADHLCESANYYAQVLGMEENELVGQAELFREVGTYNYQVGDLLVKVCADILNLAIVVITSIDGAPCIPFIPTRLCCDCPIYIAFTHSGPGHYDATRALEQAEGSKETEKGCSCGKNKSIIDGLACVVSEKTRCPCVRQGKTCSRLCRCRKCDNTMEENAGEKSKTESKPLKDVSCSCGRSKKNKDPGYEACKDGKRKSKCKCLKNGAKCSIECECYNCCNGKPEKEEQKTPMKKRRCRENPSPYKRRKGIQFLEEENLGVHRGSWTRFETYVLIEILSLISNTTITASPENLATLYNYVAEYNDAKDSSTEQFVILSQSDSD